MRFRSPRRPWWAIGSIALGALGLSFLASLYVTGYTATVTVTGGDGAGFCDVVWEDPSGRVLSGESDCYDEPAGSRFQVRVSGWPDAGEPTLTETYVGLGLVLGLPPIAAGAARLWYLARRRTLVPMPHLATPSALEGGHGAALSVERTTADLARATRRAGAVAALGAAGACAVVALAAVEIAADEDLRAVGVTTVGTVLRVDHDDDWSSGGASVRFTADGVTRARYVSLGGYADDYVEGQVVDVVYDRSDPDRFIVDDALYAPAWTGWALAPALLTAFAAGPLGVWRLSVHRQVRRVLDGRVWTPVRVRVLPDGEDRYSFTTADGVVWRSVRYGDWPEPNREPLERSGWGLPDEDPADVPYDQEACWVCDGEHAVFSPDQGPPLVLARRV
ncbi:DUF3592 domain-containing protein [Geodermatophilus sp. DSM 45219]|uniref:DUF3592 domain-containing protein n=1 Tax=Geodermatophilus sp. DSM 45219 TaxID=1881103 RepID=UPI00088C7D0A|nr:DUF3592 domain-containing protein [Geodermatophilus sp. DSM 45219]SDN48393.1 hypothetical protein SAMN05428965_0589 [Geodermatophilus sp. DSM 45219]